MGKLEAREMGLVAMERETTLPSPWSFCCFNGHLKLSTHPLGKLLKILVNWPGLKTICRPFDKRRADPLKSVIPI